MRQFQEPKPNLLKRFIAQCQGDAVEKFFEKTAREIERLKNDFDATIKEDPQAFKSDIKNAPELFMLLQTLTIGELTRLKASFDNPDNRLDNRLMAKRLAVYLEPINAQASASFRNVYEEIRRRYNF